MSNNKLYSILDENFNNFKKKIKGKSTFNQFITINSNKYGIYHAEFILPIVNINGNYLLSNKIINSLNAKNKITYPLVNFKNIFSNDIMEELDEEFGFALLALYIPTERANKEIIKNNKNFKLIEFSNNYLLNFLENNREDIKYIIKNFTY